MGIKKLLLIFPFIICVVCGNSIKSLRGGRITNGIQANRTQFPYQCAIYIYTDSEKGSNFCSGSIISENFILSAAHCFEDMNYGIILAGIIDLNDENAPYDWDFDANDVIIHEHFNRFNISNDIALIDVSVNPFNFSATEKISKIYLGELSYNELIGLKGRIAGWGRASDNNLDVSNVLYFIDAEILDQESCSSVYGPKVTSKTLCLSGKERQSTCAGDSGGGLTLTKNDSTVLIGIVSFGAEIGCEKEYPTVLTFILPYLEWIYSKIN